MKKLSAQLARSRAAARSIGRVAPKCLEQAFFFGGLAGMTAGVWMWIHAAGVFFGGVVMFWLAKLIHEAQTTR